MGPALVFVFKNIENTVGLTLNIKKCVILTLWRNPSESLRKLIKEHIPAWQSMALELTTKYHGFGFGPGSAGCSWQRAVTSCNKLVSIVRAASWGDFSAIMFSRMYFLSTLHFPAQFCKVNAALHKAYLGLVLKASGPSDNWTCGEAMTVLCGIGFLAEYPNLKVTSRAAMWAASFRNNSVWQPIRTKTNEVENHLNMPLLNPLRRWREQSLAVQYENAYKEIFASGLDSGLSGRIKVDCVSRSLEDNLQLQKNMTQQVIQLRSVPRFDITIFIAMRLKRWFAHTGDPEAYACRCVEHLKNAASSVAPCIQHAYLRTCLNGRHTDRRYQCAPTRRCVLDVCCDGEDGIEHYATCKHQWEALRRIGSISTPACEQTLINFLQLRSRVTCRLRLMCMQLWYVYIYFGAEVLVCPTMNL